MMPASPTAHFILPHTQVLFTLLKARLNVPSHTAEAGQRLKRGARRSNCSRRCCCRRSIASARSVSLSTPSIRDLPDDLCRPPLRGVPRNCATPIGCAMHALPRRRLSTNRAQAIMFLNPLLPTHATSLLINAGHTLAIDCDRAVGFETHHRRHHVPGKGVSNHNQRIRSRIAVNRLRGIATSAIWKTV